MMLRSMLSQSEASALAAAAGALGIPSDWLFTAINAESRWNPAIKNPRSSARGLLQWVDATARDLGYDDSADLVAQNPTIEAQLAGPVVAYLKRYAPIRSIEDLAAIIFYPAYRGRLDDALPDSVQRANPGIRTVRDYANRYLSSKLPVGASLGVGAVLVAVGVGWWWMRTRAKG